MNSSTSKKPWCFSDITEALRKSVKFAYRLTRKNRNKDIPWDGPLLTTTSILVCSWNIDETLTQEQLEYNAERGRDPMHTILCCAVQLGIEQGMRMKNEKVEEYRMFIQSLKDKDERERMEKTFDLFCCGV